MSNEKQSSLSPSASADEINRLYAEAERLRAESRDTLHVSVVAAWKAGQLLVAENAVFAARWERAHGCFG